MAPIREDHAGSRQLRFRVAGKPLNLFKAKGESTHHVYLKVLVYALYQEQYEQLQFDPHVDGRYQPHVASLDLAGDVVFWAHCGEAKIEEVAHILKHSDAREVVLVKEAVDIPGYVAHIKRQIHYRYTNGKLRILSFQPLDDWFDPEQVEIPADGYETFAF